jgi:hypothetical protein
MGSTKESGIMKVIKFYDEEIEMPVDNINKIGLMNAIRKEHGMGIGEANKIATTVYWEIEKQQEEFIKAKSKDEN